MPKQLILSSVSVNKDPHSRLNNVSRVKLLFINYKKKLQFIVSTLSIYFISILFSLDLTSNNFRINKNSGE